MIIQKIFSAEDNERIYSVIMTEEEMKLYSKNNQKNRLTLADQDYLEDIDSEIKGNRIGMPLSGGILGGMTGGVIGGSVKGAKGAVVGGALGTAAGAYGMHKVNKKHVEPKLKREKEKYVKSTPKDREYFRRKREQQKNREAMIAAGIYAGR